MRLHVIYRSTGPDNAKGRPPYHSKLRSLRSLLRAWDAVDVCGSLVFVNNGPIPAERLEVMHSAVWRAALVAAALARRRSPSRLAAARSCPSTHVETGVIALGTDWSAEAYLPADRV